MEKGFGSSNRAASAGQRYRIVKVIELDGGQGFRWELIEGLEGASPDSVVRAARTNFASWMDAWEAGNAAHVRLRAAEFMGPVLPLERRKS